MIIRNKADTGKEGTNLLRCGKTSPCFRVPWIKLRTLPKYLVVIIGYKREDSTLTDFTCVPLSFTVPTVGTIHQYFSHDHPPGSQGQDRRIFPELIHN
jgi:hypothetical protein